MGFDLLMFVNGRVEATAQRLWREVKLGTRRLKLWQGGRGFWNRFPDITVEAE